jgi:hypothetical protein
MALEKLVAIDVGTGLAIQGIGTDLEWGCRIRLDEALKIPMKSSSDFSSMGKHGPVDLRQDENGT